MVRRPESTPPTIANLLVQLQDIGEPVRTHAPFAGEHTVEILPSLGYSATGIEELERSGAIGTSEPGS